jgi:uncharacterized integral membrane protein
MAKSDRSEIEGGTSPDGIPWRLIGGGVLIVAIVVFLVENTAKVSIRFVGPRVHAPLIVALLIAAVLGSLATLLIQHRRARR